MFVMSLFWVVLVSKPVPSCQAEPSSVNTERRSWQQDVTLTCLCAVGENKWNQQSMFWHHRPPTVRELSPPDQLQSQRITSALYPGELFISFIKCFHHPAFIRWVNIPRLGDQTRHTLKLMNQGELFHSGSFQCRQRGWSGVFWMFLLSGRRQQRKVITQVHGGYQTGWWWNVYWEVCP